MKLSELIIHLNNMAKENPEILNYEVISSSDDEGNDFNPVLYTPTLGHYNPSGWGYEKFQTDVDDHNAICLN